MTALLIYVVTIPGSSQGREGVLMSCMAEQRSYDHRPSHPYKTGTEHVGFFADQGDIAGGGRRTRVLLALSQFDY